MTARVMLRLCWPATYPHQQTFKNTVRDNQHDAEILRGSVCSVFSVRACRVSMSMCVCVALSLVRLRKKC